MELIHFAIEHAAGLGWAAMIASLLIAALELRHANKAHKVSNLIAINRHHWELWSQLYQYPKLERILSPTPDLEQKPVTAGEIRFVNSVILHLNTARKAESAGMFIEADGTEMDVADFFALPIPKSVWSKSRAFHDRKLVEFVEKSLASRENQFSQDEIEKPTAAEALPSKWPAKS
jgi:hypothetical protein